MQDSKADYALVNAEVVRNDGQVQEFPYVSIHVGEGVFCVLEDANRKFIPQAEFSSVRGEDANARKAKHHASALTGAREVEFSFEIDGDKIVDELEQNEERPDGYEMDNNE